MAIQNAVNISVTGLVKAAGDGTFTGVTTTNHDVLVGAASNGITNVAPSATSGIPLVSGGASSDPSFTTAVVAGGGTGLTSATAYAVICGGTTTTGAFQPLAALGSTGNVLTSNGAGALPSFQAASSGSGWVLLSTATASTSASLTFTSGLTSTYNLYAFVIDALVNDTTTVTLNLKTSANGGSTWDGSANNYAQTGIKSKNGGAVASYTGATTSYELTDNTVATTGNHGQSGIVYVIDPSASAPVVITATMYSADNVLATDVQSCYFCTGCRNAAAAINGVQFLFSSGNITSGVIKLYGCGPT